MKRNLVVSLVIINCILFSSVDFLSAKKARYRSFKGRIINLTDNYFEIKWGNKEIIVYTTEKSKYLSKKGKIADRGTIEICQVVKAYYRIKNKKKRLVKIRILKKSNCK